MQFLKTHYILFWQQAIPKNNANFNKRNALKASIFTVLITLFSTVLFAQNVTIKGTITADDGSPLPGASVKVKDGSSATIANENGKYELKILSSNKEATTLVFSFLSYATQEIKWSGANELNVVLRTDFKTLADVVVVGYGTSRRKDLTGAISSIKKSDFENQPLADVSQTLKGLAPGVSVTQTSGAPGSDVKIRIRGISSILGNNAPLLVIDGVQSSINLNDLNPNDIESLEILKDASSTAIYGSRGANGVIMITTKRGDKNAAPKVEFNSFASLNNNAFRYDLLGPVDYANLVNKLNPNTFSNQDLDYFNSFGGTDWQDVLLQTGILKSSSLSVTGGNKNTSYLFSGNIIDETGLVIGSKRNRYALRTNIQSNISDKLKLGLNLAVSKNNTRNVSASYQEIWDAVNWSPTALIFQDDNTYNQIDRFGSIRPNPYMLLKERNSDNNNLLGIAGLNLDYQIIPSLTFNTTLGITYSPGNFAFANNEFIDPRVSAGQGSFNTLFWQSSNTLTFQKSISENHRFTVMAGFEEQKRESRSFGASGNGFQLPAVGYDNLGLASVTSIRSGYSAEALRSFFGRSIYTFRNKYLFTLTYRADGSSKFKGNNKYSYFPSAAVAWKLEEEEFIKKLDIFSNLKLRASWGITGNQAISAYSTIGLLTPTNHNFGTTTLTPGYLIEGAGNANLRWEETKQYDLGLDVGLFENRFNLTLDYYNRRTTGLLQATTLPAYNGGGNIIQNIGEMLNTGVDLGLNANIIKANNISWDASANFSVINNKVVSLGEETQLFPSRGDQYYVFENSNSHVVKVGEPLGAFWGIKHLGIWQADEVAAAAVYNAKPGDNKYLDFNNDQKINGNDFHVIGQSLPKFRWGFNNNIIYKKFTLNLFVEGVMGNKVFNAQFASAAIPSSNGRTITLAEGANYWTPNNTNAKYGNPLSSSNLNYSNSSQWLQDGSFIRFRNISLAYQFNKSQVKIANIKIYASAQNLFTLTKFVGSDPEGTVSGPSDSYGGYNSGSFPTAKTLTLGLIFTN